MRRYARHAWTGTQGWAPTALTLLAVPLLLIVGVPVLMGMAALVLDSAFGVSSGPQIFDALEDQGFEVAFWVDRLVVVGAVSGALLSTLVVTQRAFRRRALRTYITGASRMRWRRVALGAVGGGAVGILALGMGAMLGAATWAEGGWMRPSAYVGVAAVCALTAASVEVVRGMALQAALRTARHGGQAALTCGAVFGLLALGAAHIAFAAPPLIFVAFAATLGAVGTTVWGLADDGFEGVLGAEMGVAAVVLGATVGRGPLQVTSPTGLGLLLVGSALGVAAAGARWAGWTRYDLLRVLTQRVAAPAVPGDTEATEQVARCLNCGTPLAGPYCQTCGQKGVDRHRSLTAILADLFDVLFEVDGRIWQTLRLLFLQPGRLTALYNAGHRKEFIRPLRLYIAFSFLFFVALITFPPGTSSSTVVGDVLGTRADTTTAGELPAFANQVEVDGLVTQVSPARQTLSVEGIALVVDPATTFEETGGLDSLRAGDQHVEVDARRTARALRAQSVQERGPEEERRLSAPLDYVGREALRALGASVRLTDSTEFEETEGIAGFRIGDRVDLAYVWRDSQRVATEVGPAESFGERLFEEGDEGAVEQLIQNFSRAMFLLVPIFAGLLQVLYLRTPYIGHLIFALHEHAFLFFAGTAVVVAALLPSPARGVVVGGLFLCIPVYLTLSLRMAYDDSWLGAVLKCAFLLIAYLVLLLFSFGGIVGFLSS